MKSGRPLLPRLGDVSRLTAFSLVIRNSTWRRGYILVAFSLSLIVILGFTGLAIDIGRMYIAKNESQSFVDSMALVAALRLNGDKSGLTAADLAVESGVNSKLWHLGLEPFTGYPTTYVEYSSSKNPGVWQSSSAVVPGPAIPGVASNPVPTDRVRVTTSVTLPLYFLPVLVGSTASAIPSTATAVRSSASGFPTNALMPMSPISHGGPTSLWTDDPADPNGFKQGDYYTLFWDKSGSNKTTTCADDAKYSSFVTNANANSPKWLGGVCQGAEPCKDVLGGGDQLSITDPEVTKEGQVASIFMASNDRVARDTDPTSTTYSSYHGDGTRIITVAISDGVVSGTGNNSRTEVVGFGSFLLLSSTENKGAICGQYLGCCCVPGQPESCGLISGNPIVTNSALMVRLVK